MSQLLAKHPLSNSVRRDYTDPIMTTCDLEFRRRVTRIPPHGLGLSVDVYTPALFELVRELDGSGLPYGYLEIFRAPTTVLEAVRKGLPSTLLEYHAEGIWVTQPELETDYPLEAELAETVAQLRALGSHWLNHECASKQIAGYSFGTYLPPLFTRASAALTAENVTLVQQRLDDLSAAPGRPGPLLLLELPPLTYFGAGDLPVAEFFRRLTERTACGLVLDVGHLWTVYCYMGEWRRRSMEAFVEEFLAAFPLERVVQVHLAGLACHPDDVPSIPSDARPCPRWIDAHAAPIPAVLYEMLEQVLAHPDLKSLEGVGLEVDTKPVSLILSEFERVRARFGKLVERLSQRGDPGSLAFPHAPPEPSSVEGGLSIETRSLREEYELYARTVTGLSSADLPTLFRSFGTETESLNAYLEAYLPHEILVWGGDLRAMFPETCRALDAHRIPLAGFVHYWFREARTVLSPYDFFLLKTERFCAYVEEVLPSAACTATREAAELRAAYENVKCDASCVPRPLDHSRGGEPVEPQVRDALSLSKGAMSGD